MPDIKNQISDGKVCYAWQIDTISLIIRDIGKEN